MQQGTAVLVHKIRELSADQINEVDNFIEFIRLRGEDVDIVRGGSAMSTPAFETVWANPEDDVYDAL